MKKLLCLGLAAGMLSACNGAAPMLAAAPAMVPQARAQSDAGVRNALKIVFQEQFALIDKNKDAAVTKDEIPAMSDADFARADQDHDRKVTFKEYLYATSKQNQGAFQYLKNAAYQSFVQIDANHNGFATKEEFQAFLAGQPTEFRTSGMTTFLVADRNRDGKVTLSEFEDASALVFAGAVLGGGVTPGFAPPATPGQGAVTPPPPPLPTEPSEPAPAPAAPAAPATK